MDTLWVLQAHLLDVTIRPVDSLWSPVEDCVLHIGELVLVAAELVFWLLGSLEAPAVVEETLLAVKSGTCASALHQLLDEPLQHGVGPRVIQALDLMRSDRCGALHFS